MMFVTELIRLIYCNLILKSVRLVNTIIKTTTVRDDDKLSILIRNYNIYRTDSLKLQLHNYTKRFYQAVNFSKRNITSFRL